MSTRKLHFGVTIALAVTIMATAIVGYASATTVDSATDEGRYSSSYYSFWVEASSRGGSDYATARNKTISSSYAYFDLQSVKNNSGYVAYIGACDCSHTGAVTTMKAVSGTGTYNSYYKSGYGNVGTNYRPYGRSNSSAVTSAYLSGYWRP